MLVEPHSISKKSFLYSFSLNLHDYAYQSFSGNGIRARQAQQFLDPGLVIKIYWTHTRLRPGPGPRSIRLKFLKKDLLD
jgi:hypothetical protein